MHWVRACSRAELAERNVITFTGGGRPVAVFEDGGALYAVDSRCPHMGFPLAKGTLKNGILTCHWHSWQFDASGGGCFTQGGSPVAAYRVESRGPDVYVELPADDAAAQDARWRDEMRQGVERFSTLRLAKAIYVLFNRDAPLSEFGLLGAQVGTAWREDFSSGLSILTATLNLARDLDLPVAIRTQALVHGLRSVASDVRETPPRRFRGPLPATAAAPARLSAWFRSFVHDREEEAAERVLTTVIQTGSPADVETMIQAALADHVFVDEGHAVDFANKAFELLGHVGWPEALRVLPTLIHEMCTGTRHEEDMAWKVPNDLISLARETDERMEAAAPGGGASRESLVDAVLAEDPRDVAKGLVAAHAGGLALPEIALAVAEAAAMRLGRFHTRNEFTDWEWAHHALTTAHALRRMTLRTPSPHARRLVVQSAFYVFLSRFLNIPKHPMPHDSGRPSSGTIQDVVSMMQLRRPDEVDGAVHAVFGSGPNPDALKTWAAAALREDLGFHGFQEVELAVRLHRDLAGTPRAYVPLAAASRYLAAHLPSPRFVAQTVDNAIKLVRGEVLHE